MTERERDEFNSKIFIEWKVRTEREEFKRRKFRKLKIRSERERKEFNKQI